jgi:hypothetical protein
MNKKIVSIFSAAILAVGAVAATNAAVLVSDTFTYSDGALAGNTPEVGAAWAGYSGSTFDIQVASHAANVNEATGVQDDKVTFDGGFTDATGTVLYSSEDVTVASPTTLASVYFSFFLQGTGSFASRLWVTTPLTAGDGFRFALSNNSSVTATGVVYSPDLNFGQTYTVATSYDFANKNGTLWINPADTSSVGQTATDAGFADAVTAYAFRQSASTGNVVISVDNLKVGSSFSDVVAPEPASLSLLGMGAIGLMARRRK